MKSHLKVTLGKYYCKKGNRLVFQNGMDLNQLAMAMWENLGFKGVDSSVISRVINGKRLFTYVQLRVFCQILELSQQQRNVLFSALTKDLLCRFGTDYPVYGSVALDDYKQISTSETQKISSHLNRLSKKSLILFRKLMNLLVPSENSLSHIQFPFSQKSYYSLLDYTLHHRHYLLDPRFAGFEVSLPFCPFSQTVRGLGNNCRCGYHLSLYGVIDKAFHLKIFSHDLIQQEVNRWINFFFPLQAVINYLKKSQNVSSCRQLLEELAIP